MYKILKIKIILHVRLVVVLDYCICIAIAYKNLIIFIASWEVWLQCSPETQNFVKGFPYKLHGYNFNENF